MEKIEDKYAPSVGYTVDYAFADIQRGGDIPTFREAKRLLVEAMREELLEAQHKPAWQVAYNRYNKARNAQNPDRFTTYEEMGFAPLPPLTALNLDGEG